MSNSGGQLVIAGGSGFLGKHLIAAARDRYPAFVVLTRGRPHVDGNVRYVNWDAATLGDWAHELEGAAGVVNLVGRTVDCRKTPENKRVILESRVHSIAALAAAMRQCKAPPPVWVQSGTAHIVGDPPGDLVCDESTPGGEGFAPDVGRAWEAALNDADIGDCRRVITRISFVLGRDGGALKTLARFARFGLGGTIGSGKQWMSWIHVEDLNAILLRALEDQTMSGPYMVTAPHPVRNEEFMSELRKAVRRPWSPPVPAPLVRIGCRLLSTDPELALLGRRCVPTRLMKEGFKFRFPTLRDSLAELFQ